MSVVNSLMNCLICSFNILPRRDKRTVQRKTRLEDGLDRRENEGRVIQRQ